MGITTRMWGTIVSNSVALRKDVIVKFDRVTLHTTTPWYSGAEEQIPCLRTEQKWQMPENTRVILEYITDHRSGLWYARLPLENEHDPKASA